MPCPKCLCQETKSELRANPTTLVQDGKYCLTCLENECDGKGVVGNHTDSTLVGEKNDNVQPSIDELSISATHPHLPLPQVTFRFSDSSMSQRWKDAETVYFDSNTDQKHRALFSDFDTVNNYVMGRKTVIEELASELQGEGKEEHAEFDTVIDRLVQCNAFMRNRSDEQRALFRDSENLAQVNLFSCVDQLSMLENLLMRREKEHMESKTLGRSKKTDGEGVAHISSTDCATLIHVEGKPGSTPANVDREKMAVLSRRAQHVFYQREVNADSPTYPIINTQCSGSKISLSLCVFVGKFSLYFDVVPFFDVLTCTQDDFREFLFKIVAILRISRQDFDRASDSNASHKEFVPNVAAPNDTPAKPKSVGGKKKSGGSKKDEEGNDTNLSAHQQVLSSSPIHKLIVCQQILHVTTDMCLVACTMAGPTYTRNVVVKVFASNVDELNLAAATELTILQHVGSNFTFGEQERHGLSPLLAFEGPNCSRSLPGLRSLTTIKPGTSGAMLVFPRYQPLVLKHKLVVDLTVPRICTIALELFHGMVFLHGRVRVAHMDIKPDNLCLADDGTLRIIDFGISVLLDTKEANICVCRRGTWGYYAPELNYEDHCESEQCDGVDMTKCDVWSAATTLLHLLAATVLGMGLGKEAMKSDPDLLLQRLSSTKAIVSYPNASNLLCVLQDALSSDPHERDDAAACLLRLKNRDALKKNYMMQELSVNQPASCMRAEMRRKH